jgi:enoyl-CoA hydratase
MIDFDVLDRVGVITIRRPEARNAVNGEVASGIETALDKLEQDPDLWAGILAAEGPVFSAGADLKAIAAGQANSLRTARGGFGGITQRERTKPIVAAVDGPALAGGCEIALACDLIVASRQAVFGLPEVKRSLIAAAGGLIRLPRMLAPKVALEMILTGDPISAERAYDLGLVNQLVEPGQAFEAAKALAGRITANAPVAVWLSRRIALKAVAGDDEWLWKMTFDSFGEVGQTEDFSEGPRAFIEKRPPVWMGVWGRAGRLAGAGATGSGKDIQHAVLMEKLGQAVDQPELGDLTQGNPRCFGGVVASSWLLCRQDGDPEVQDHVVVALAKALNPADQSVTDPFQSGFLGQLPDHRLSKRLAKLHPAAWNRPLSRRRPVAAPDHQQVVSVDSDGADADQGPGVNHRAGGTSPAAGP